MSTPRCGMGSEAKPTHFSFIRMSFYYINVLFSLVSTHSYRWLYEAGSLEGSVD